MEELSRLGKKEELEYRQIKFSGKSAGKAWEYYQTIDGLIRTRAIIFLMAILVFYPILSNYIFYDFFSMELLIERVIFSVLLFSSGYIFNKYRVFAIVLSSVPMMLIFITYITIENQFDIKKIGYSGAIVILILSGLYYHYKAKKLKKKLDCFLPENQLIEN